MAQTLWRFHRGTGDGQVDACERFWRKFFDSDGLAIELNHLASATLGREQAEFAERQLALLQLFKHNSADRTGGPNNG